MASRHRWTAAASSSPAGRAGGERASRCGVCRGSRWPGPQRFICAWSIAIPDSAINKYIMAVIIIRAGMIAKWWCLWWYYIISYYIVIWWGLSGVRASLVCQAAKGPSAVDLCLRDVAKWILHEDNDVDKVAMMMIIIITTTTIII